MNNSTEYNPKPLEKYPAHLSPEDLIMREATESDPAHYILKVYPEINSANPDANRVYTEIMFGNTISGIIDLGEENGKYTIWLGEDHMNLHVKALKTPDDPRTSSYLIGIKVTSERGGANIHVIRDMIGQSCNRTPQQIENVLAAVDTALKRDLAVEDSDAAAVSEIDHRASALDMFDTEGATQLLKDLDALAVTIGTKQERTIVSKNPYTFPNRLASIRRQIQFILSEEE